ncbi:MAG: hypothetical protein JW751_10645 [Polyangiaceae bacterium]|nr:hypothetical protein [Polyangiaceae bacterium]
MTRLLLRGVTLASTLALVSGCAGNPMDPYSRLTSLRLLAIQSEPVVPGPGETTTLTPLLYVPDGQSEPELEWSWCPFPGDPDEGYPCEVTEEDFGDLDELREAGIDVTLPPLDLGTGATLDFENSIHPLLLAMLCSGMNSLPPEVACPHGFPVQIKVRVRTDEDELVAVRTLYLGYAPAEFPNTNPELPGLEMKVDGEWTEVSEDFDIPVKRDEENWVRALVTEDQAESYETTALEGEVLTVRERLYISWFVETGDTFFARTGYIEDVASMEVLNENRWYPEREEDYPDDTAELVMVLWDDRGGTNWWRHTFNVAEEEK